MSNDDTTPGGQSSPEESGPPGATVSSSGIPATGISAGTSGPGAAAGTSGAAGPTGGIGTTGGVGTLSGGIGLGSPGGRVPSAGSPETQSAPNESRSTEDPAEQQAAQTE